MHSLFALKCKQGLAYSAIKGSNVRSNFILIHDRIESCELVDITLLGCTLFHICNNRGKKVHYTVMFVYQTTE